jgi:hypothetical protein
MPRPLGVRAVLPRHECFGDVLFRVRPCDTTLPAPVPAICPASCVHRRRASAPSPACCPHPRHISHLGILAQNSRLAPCYGSVRHRGVASCTRQCRIGGLSPPGLGMIKSRLPGSPWCSQDARQTPETCRAALDDLTQYAPWVPRLAGAGHTKESPRPLRAHRQCRERGRV